MRNFALSIIIITLIGCGNKSREITYDYTLKKCTYGEHNCFYLQSDKFQVDCVKDENKFLWDVIEEIDGVHIGTSNWDGVVIYFSGEHSEYETKIREKISKAQKCYHGG